MEQVSLLIEAFDMLDLVLAIFGAIIVSMWFGRGKSIWVILSGAVMGGLVKPMLFMFMVGGAFVATQSIQDKPLTKQEQADQEKIIKFWTQTPSKKH